MRIQLNFDPCIPDMNSIWILEITRRSENGKQRLTRSNQSIYPRPQTVHIQSIHHLHTYFHHLYRYRRFHEITDTKRTGTCVTFAFWRKPNQNDQMKGKALAAITGSGANVSALRWQWNAPTQTDAPIEMHYSMKYTCSNSYRSTCSPFTRENFAYQLPFRSSDARNTYDSAHLILQRFITIQNLTMSANIQTNASKSFAFDLWLFLPFTYISLMKLSNHRL